MTFPSSHPALARALAARNYDVPTAVQLAVLQETASARDLLVSAQTGSGKTVAFGLAIAPALLGDAERFERAAEPLALVIAPTRELAMQVQRELAWLYADTGARVVTCVGGMDARAEARQLEQGAHIVVGTPGRLRDHLERRRLQLSTLRAIVLDEADEMLDLGFREDLEFILDATPEARQTLLFSATMPREIETLARRYQRDALRIETIRRDEAHADIEYRAIAVAPHEIENAVVNVLRLHEVRATLVFCATREAVKRMQARLLERGFSAVALSGELTQHERTQALQALRDGRARVLVATDVAARGLDLPDLALVIHADLPNDRETLLHRSGRTGRAGRKGLVTLIVPFNRRRKGNMLLDAAKVKATWGPPPSAEEIRARDHDRFLADEIFANAPVEDELASAAALQSARKPEEIALALLRLHRARLPAPEDFSEDTGPPPRGEKRSFGEVRRRDDRPRPDRASRSERTPRGERDSSDAPFERAPRSARREDTREMVWFRLNIGRERNADPRWLVPLICKAGGISKAEIGSIKIFDRDTRFQIVADQADAFAHSVRTNKTKEGHISRVGAHSAADNEAVETAISAIAAAEAAAPPRPAKDRFAGSKEARREDDRPVRDKAALPRERAKAPWHERKKADAPPHAHRKGPPPQSARPDREPKDGKPSAFAARGKPVSKYAHKKKHRPDKPGAV